MSIQIKIGGNKTDKTVQLKLQKTLDDNIIIFDHIDMDIIIMPNKNKIMALAKEKLTEDVYISQERLFDFMHKNGVIDYGSVRGGNIYGSMEAELLKSDQFDSVKSALLVIEKFIEEEKDYFDVVKEVEDSMIDYFYDPNAEESTELGEIPHKERDGSMVNSYPKNFAHFGWWT